MPGVWEQPGCIVSSRPDWSETKCEILSQQKQGVVMCGDVHLHSCAWEVSTGLASSRPAGLHRKAIFFFFKEKYSVLLKSKQWPCKILFILCNWEFTCNFFFPFLRARACGTIELYKAIKLVLVNNVKFEIGMNLFLDHFLKNTSLSQLIFLCVCLC